MELLSKYKSLFILLATMFCIIVSIVTINFKRNPTFFENTLGYVVIPLQKASTDISSWIGKKITYLANSDEIEKENIELRKRVEELEAEQNRMELIELENKKLSDLFLISQKYAQFPTVGAEIIANDTGNWYNRFIIGKGTNSGLANNMVVLASGGLVGKILEAGTTYSKVISLVDDTSSIRAKSVRTNDAGFVKGDMELAELGLCRMDHIDSKAEILEGDEIVTSQLSDIYPPGITIGVVKEIHLEANGLTKYAIVQPVVDFRNLETVLVINKGYSNLGVSTED